MKIFKFLAATLALGLLSLNARAEGPADVLPAVNPDAARTVLLLYPAPEASLYYNEVTIEESVPGSFFMGCGFTQGYFGIQELVDGKKTIIFSVWDPAQGNDPDVVKAEDRVEALSQGEGVEVKRFGGEGTGGQSFWPYDWKIGVTYKLLVSSEIKGERTIYTGYFYVPEQKRWQKMVSFSTKTGGAPIKNIHSFIEDFRRDGKSANQIRRARFGNGWVRATPGYWVPLIHAYFTADGNTQLHINATVSGDTFALQNGGATINTTPLGTTLVRALPGVELPDLTVK